MINWYESDYGRITWWDVIFWWIGATLLAVMLWIMLTVCSFVLYVIEMLLSGV